MEIKTEIAMMEPSPEKIESLKENEIFVFGANEAGKHGAGAAKLALMRFGANYGQGEGLQGRSYGIPTKNHKIETLPLYKVEYYVQKFLKFAEENPDKTFLVTQIGCGLAGFLPGDIAPLFKDCPDNVRLPKEFIKELEG